MIHVFIVDDHPLVIEGMRSLLALQKDVDVTGHAMSAKACLENPLSITADVILIDIGLPDMSGIDLCAEIRSRNPSVMILTVSSFHDGCYIKKMIGSGANGYIFKDDDSGELLQGIHEVSKGKTYFSFDAGKALTQENEPASPLLTRREKEILGLIAEGYTNPQIAKKLFISLSTADSHRKNLMAKLGVKNTAMLIRTALDHVLI